MQPVIMLLMSGFFMFAVIGGISLLAHYYTLNGIKSKTVGDGQHGTARFATREEIKDTYEQIPYEPELWRKGEHLPEAQGIILGSEEQHGKLYALVDTDDVHCLMIGAAGIGKTANFLYPNLEYACACGMSFLTTDMKGDLYRNYGGIAKKYYGYEVAVIDLRNPTRSDGDNMLHLVNKYMDEYRKDNRNLSAKAKAMLPQFFNIEGLDERCIVVKEGEELDLGNHHLKFIMAPMVHWPEVMVEYETTEKVLFSADGFGKFGALSHDEDWACEARRYYFNIVGKYGAPVQTLLKKASTLDIKMICPLHGPILKDNLGYYIDKYQIWSSYQSEDEGVLVASASIHGNTKEVALKVVDLLKEKGVKVAFTDLTRDDIAEAVEDAFRYSKMILAGATYDGGVFSPMEDFLHRLQHKGYQNKTVGLIENGSWAPLANKVMKEMLTPMKNVTICENTVTIKSTYKDENQEAIQKEVRRQALEKEDALEGVDYVLNFDEGEVEKTLIVNINDDDIYKNET